MALERGGAWRWVPVGLLSAATVYTHYTGVGVIVAQAAWAFAAHPAARRPVVIVHVAAAVAFLPWLGELRTDPLYAYALLAPESVADVLEVFARVLPDHPFVPLAEIPGRALLAVFAVALLAGARRPPPGRLVRGPAGAVLSAAVATPVALAGFGIVGDYTVLFARSLTPSVPAAVVLLGAAAWAVRPVAARAAVVAGVVVPLLAGAVLTLGPDHRRPDYRPIARWLDETGRPRDLVVHSTYAFKGTALDQVLVRSMDRPLAQEFLGLDDERIWARAARLPEGARVFPLRSQAEPFASREPPSSTGLAEVGRGPTGRGWTPVSVTVYER